MRGVIGVQGDWLRLRRDLMGACLSSESRRSSRSCKPASPSFVLDRLRSLSSGSCSTDAMTARELRSSEMPERLTLLIRQPLLLTWSTMSLSSSRPCSLKLLPCRCSSLPPALMTSTITGRNACKRLIVTTTHDATARRVPAAPCRAGLGAPLEIRLRQSGLFRELAAESLGGRTLAGRLELHRMR